MSRMTKENASQGNPVEQGVMRPTRLKMQHRKNSTSCATRPPNITTRAGNCAMEWEQNLESYVQDQPIKSLLIAAGVGALLGFLWRRS